MTPERFEKPFALLFDEFWRILSPRTPAHYTFTSFLKLLVTEILRTATGNDYDKM